MLRFSEAMRLGSMMNEQAFGVLIEEGVDGYRTCAIGAAMDAVGILTTKGADSFIVKNIRPRFLREWQPLLRTRVKCPARGGACYACYKEWACFSCRRKRTLSLTIQHLNDDHDWTREDIASWIEIMEDAFLSSGVLLSPEELISAGAQK